MDPRLRRDCDALVYPLDGGDQVSGVLNEDLGLQLSGWLRGSIARRQQQVEIIHRHLALPSASCSAWEDGRRSHRRDSAQGGIGGDPLAVRREPSMPRTFTARVTGTGMGGLAIAIWT